MFRFLNRQIILYAVVMAVLLMLLKWLELRFMIYTFSFEIYAGAIAVVFMALGIWLAKKLTRPKPEVKTLIIEKEAPPLFVLSEQALKDTGISKRELEVLQLMADGLSNREIADKLFVSPNTVKTHTSSLFLKLSAERRTQAVQRAKELRLIP